MTKITAGIAGVLLLALVGLLFVVQGLRGDLRAANDATTTAKQGASTARSALETTNRQQERLESRLDALDAAVGVLAGRISSNNQALGQKLDDLKTIQPTEGDAPNAIQCLDVPVAGQLDQWLRN